MSQTINKFYREIKGYDMMVGVRQVRKKAVTRTSYQDAPKGCHIQHSKILKTSKIRSRKRIEARNITEFLFDWAMDKILLDIIDRKNSFVIPYHKSMEIAPRMDEKGFPYLIVKTGKVKKRAGRRWEIKTGRVYHSKMLRHLSRGKTYPRWNH